MKIAIGTFAFCLTRELKQMVDSAQSNHDLVFYISLHSDRPDVREVCHEIVRTRKTVYYPHGFNRGLARSINDMITDAYASGADVYINCNDDILWGEGDVDRLAECAMDNPTMYMVSAKGYPRSTATVPTAVGDSCCVLGKHTLETVGCWDENLFPIYYEDIDHQQRARRLGMTSMDAPNTCVRHKGSASIYSSHDIAFANNASFLLNQQYIIKKWGPDLNWEYPFKNPALGYKIEPKDRRAPYGREYDREDLPPEPLKEESRA